MPFELNDTLLAETLAASARPVVVAFVSPLAIPCRHFAPEFQATAEEMISAARFYTIDAIENPSATERWKVGYLPTTKLFMNGQVRCTYEGPYSKEALIERLGKAIAEAEKGAGP